MKLPLIGGGLFLLTGVGALAAVTFASSTSPSSADSAAASGIRAQPTTVDAAAGTVVYHVPDMHCEFACAPKVRETLEGIAGVETVETDVEDQTVTVHVSAAFDSDAALAALTKANYPGQLISR